MLQQCSRLVDISRLLRAFHLQQRFRGEMDAMHGPNVRLADRSFLGHILPEVRWLRLVWLCRTRDDRVGSKSEPFPCSGPCVSADVHISRVPPLVLLWPSIDPPRCPERPR